MIQVKDLVKKYGNHTALDHVSFTVDKGEVLGLLGKNGAGKSTTMNIITGNLAATEGTVMIEGSEILEEPLAAKRKIGYLPEIPPVYPEMTVKKYLQFVFGLKKCTLNRERHIKEICEQTRITDVYERIIKNLSKGYKQRVGIAQALIGNPEILILDEPTVGLDPQQIVEIRQLISHLKERHTIILSSHILTEIQSACDHIVVLHKGWVVSDGTRENLLNISPTGLQLKLRVEGEQEKVTALLARIRGVQCVKRLGVEEKGSFDYLVDVEKGMDVRREIFHRLSERHFPLLYMAPRELTLENVFLQLTGENG